RGGADHELTAMHVSSLGSRVRLFLYQGAAAVAQPRRRVENAAVSRSYSTLRPANAMTLAHLSVSARMNFANSSVVIGAASEPRLANFAFRAGSARLALIS